MSAEVSKRLQSQLQSATRGAARLGGGTRVGEGTPIPLTAETVISCMRLLIELWRTYERY